MWLCFYAKYSDWSKWNRKLSTTVPKVSLSWPRWEYKKNFFFKGLGNDWVLTELQISKNSEEGKIIKFRQEGLYKVGEWPNRYFEVEGEEPNRDKRCQLWSAIPSSYYETDQGPKLDRQECSLNVETHFLTFQSPRFSVLRVNCKNFFSNESLSVHSFIRSQVIHWTFIVYSVLCIYHLYGMTFWSFYKLIGERKKIRHIQSSQVKAQGGL